VAWWPPAPDQPLAVAVAVVAAGLSPPRHLR